VNLVEVLVLVQILERLAELNHQIEANRLPFEILVIAIVLTASGVFFKFAPDDYPEKKPLWLIMLATSITAVVAFFLAPQELRWYSVALGLICAISSAIMFYIMRSLLKVTVRKGKWLGRIVWAASLVSLFSVGVSAILWWSSSSTRELFLWLGMGIVHGVFSSRAFIKHAFSRETNADAGDVGDASSLVESRDSDDTNSAN